MRFINAKIWVEFSKSADSSVGRALGLKVSDIDMGGKAGSNRRGATYFYFFFGYEFYLFYISFLRILLFTPKVINLLLFFLNVKLGLFIFWLGLWQFSERKK